MSDEKKSPKMFYVLIGIIIIILIGAAYLYLSKGKTEKNTTTTEQVTTQPQQPVTTQPQPAVPTCEELVAQKQKTADSLAAIAERAKTEAKIAADALKQAKKSCQKADASGNKPIIIYVQPNGGTSSTVSNSKGAQVVTGEYTAPAAKNVSTSVSGGNTPKGLFCVNVHDMDGASFWPQLALDAGMEVEGAVWNKDQSGHNISIFPVDQPSGLYGVTTDGHAFVRCDLLDQFSPTVIKMSGSFNGWREWVEAEKIGSYYVTR